MTATVRPISKQSKPQEKRLRSIRPQPPPTPAQNEESTYETVSLTLSFSFFDFMIPASTSSIFTSTPFSLNLEYALAVAQCSIH
jgi:hypothetical protein